VGGRARRLPYLRIDPLKADVGRVADVMPVQYAESRRALPVKVSPSEVTIATAEPFDIGWVTEIENHLRRPVRLVVSSPDDVRRYTTEFYALSRSVRAAQKTGEVSSTASFEQLVELGKAKGQLDANDQGVVQVVDWLWQYAFDQRASDIHLEPRRDMGAIRFRIDGVLHTVYQVPLAVMAAMTSRIKLLGRMDVVEKRRPLDGRIKTKRPDTLDSPGSEVEMRLSTMPTAFGEKMVMRIFDPLAAVKTVEQLGFGEHEAQRWQELIARPHGIVLVTGPTGSGKTTTLYATLKKLATEDVNVCTIEDPIEMIEPAFNQTQVHSAIDMGFAEGLRALMRQDPDIIMVGEIRDLATAEMAIQAALTGHLVFSTLHTNDSASGHHAAGRPGRAQLPDRGHRDRRAGAAAHAHAVPGLQGARRQHHPRRAGRAGQALAPVGRRAALQGRGLPGMPPHRLPRPRRPVRTAGADRSRTRLRASGAGRPGAAPPGLQGRHAPAAPGRCHEGGRRRDHHRRSAAQHAEPGRVVADCSATFAWRGPGRMSAGRPRPVAYVETTSQVAGRAP
jgi:type II secretory ATPase GspE/PulE/Tfp pilus assembly ATPase PilB-like protein